MGAALRTAILFFATATPLAAQSVDISNPQRLLFAADAVDPVIDVVDLRENEVIFRIETKHPVDDLVATPFALGMRGMYSFWHDDGLRSGMNVIGGSANNSVAADVAGATIGGGGGSFEGSPAGNSVNAGFATVGGGRGNTANGFIRVS